jgi:hypothetical protein
MSAPCNQLTGSFVLLFPSTNPITTEEKRHHFVRTAERIDRQELKQRALAAIGKFRSDASVFPNITTAISPRHIGSDDLRRHFGGLCAAATLRELLDSGRAARHHKLCDRRAIGHIPAQAISSRFSTLP